MHPLPEPRPRRPRLFSLVPRALVVLGALAAAAVQAQGADDDAGPDRGTATPRPLWEAGLVAIGATQAAYPGSAERVNRSLVLPWAVYRGRVVRAEGGNVGVRAARTEQAELDVGFAASFGSSGSGRGVRSGLPAIGNLVEFGPRLRWRLGDFGGGRLGASLPLRGVFDISNGFGYRGLAFEPALAWRTRVAGSNLLLGAGLLVGDRKLNDTFYGVPTALATATRPVHEARAGLIATRVGLTFTRRLAEDWTLFGFVRSDHLGGSANLASPLVERRNTQAVGIGLSWTAARSERPAEP